MAAEAEKKDALFLAAKAGHDDDLVALFSKPHCMPPNLKDSLGNTVLHYASGGNHEAAVRAILRHKRCNINAQNNMGDTPLHKAASRGSLKAVELLIRANVDCTLKNNDGQTAADVGRTDEIRSLCLPETDGYDSAEDAEYYNEDDEAASDSD